jgi:HEAT repeat protein
MGNAEAGWPTMKLIISTICFLAYFLISTGQAPFIKPLVQESGNIIDRNTTELNATSPQPPQRSSQTETIKKAEVDLRHGKEGERVGAAKLLGKYPSSLTSSMLVGALDDQSALVRRAAMVSLSEHFLNGFPLYDKSFVEKIFSKLGDPDVEVRREVSTLIPRLVSPMMRGGVERVMINGRPIYRASPSNLRPDLFALTQRSFLDEDAIVRQNILKYHAYLQVPLPPITLEKLLKDQDRGVLLTALDRVSSNASQPRVIAQIEKLSLHQDRGIRLKIVDVARDSNRYDTKYRSILRSMTRDSDAEVTSMAAVELARFGEKIKPEVIDRIKNYLLSAKGMSSQVTTILYAVSAMGVDGVQVYKALTGHGSSKMRTVAWQRFLSLSNSWANPEVWIPALNDRDQGVRAAVINTLRGRVGPMKMSSMENLVGSSYPDVRKFLAESLLSAESEAVAEYSFDLLIDEDLNVRTSTIRSLGGRREPGWIKIMERSLLDNEYVIQRAAMECLLTDPVRGVLVLQKYNSSNPGERISAMIRIELQRSGIQP